MEIMDRVFTRQVAGRVQSDRRLAMCLPTGRLVLGFELVAVRARGR